ncbi:MAG: SUMF1/EgtB/PvdO family nonheme iron enzyme [Anaerolineae bacterium]
MTAHYHLPNIRNLLTEGFSDTQLRQLCYDVPGFRPVYESLAAGTGKDVIVQRLIEHAERTLQLGQLLALAKEQNPARYDMHQPYDRAPLEAELAEMEQAIDDHQKLRGKLSETLFQAALVELLEKQAKLQAVLSGSGAIAQGDQARAASAGPESVAVSGDVGGHVIYAESGATIVIGEAPVKLTAVDRRSALGRYLQHVISRNRYLQLQGIRSGGKLVSIELDQIYVTLRATRQRLLEAASGDLPGSSERLGRWNAEAEEGWLAEEAAFAPGERRRGGEDAGRREAGTPENEESLHGFIASSPLRPLPSSRHLETVAVSVNEALAEYPRLVVLGDPGSGKTTLLRYLTLLYARDLAEGSGLVRDKLSLGESGHLPILLPLRQIGAFLRPRPDQGTEGHALLLEFLRESLTNERIPVPDDFFDEWLNQGRAVILLDGLDEVADPDLRRRVARLVEALARAYPNCRCLVTSRVVGYSGPARLGEAFATTTVQDFSLADVELFLSQWHRLVAVGHMGPGESAAAYAAAQTGQLLQAIRANERIRELAINPLLLTVIAMVHRDRVKLPDRRAELYAEAVDVLLGKWDEARGVAETPILEGKPFDTGDKRLMLQHLALRMHEQQQKELAAEELRRWLGERFYEVIGNWREVARTVDRFLRVIEERTGLLAARGEGVYAFSHLTFQEYLAALAIAARDDYVAYTLNRVLDPWWREVILLQAGYLSTQSRERTTRLIQAITERKEEPEPYHNLVLAAECLRDVGGNRVQGDLQGEVQRRLRADLELDMWAEIKRRRPQPKTTQWMTFWDRLRGSPGDRPFDEKIVIREIIERKAVATQALVQAGAGYWTLPYGEPEWVEVPAGSFWLGEGKAIHQVILDAFRIARTPVTNAQYQLFVKATNHEPPRHWEEGRPPRGQESHPVVRVSWDEAIAYCDWLSRVTGKKVTLPSEAEWEKAARGDKDQRAYPWGNEFNSTKCNTAELGLGDTTPVGIFLSGASLYGCLDMAGNVWEWTRSLYAAYPYDPKDGREELQARGARVLRGGSWLDSGVRARCAFRYGDRPYLRNGLIGFRLVSPIL